MKNAMFKTLNVVLTALNYFFGFFDKIYKGIWWFIKLIGVSIAKFIIMIGKSVDIAVTKGIIPAVISVGKFFKYLWKKIVQFWDFLGTSIQKGKVKYRETKFHKTIDNSVGKVVKKISSAIKYRHRKAIWGVVFIIPLMIGFVYFFLFPFITTIVYSFSNVYNTNVIGETEKVLGIVSEYVGLDNYKYVWSVHATFKSTLGDVFVNTLLDVVMILIFSLIVAVVLNSKFKGRSFVRAIFFMPVIFNSQAVNAAIATGSTLTAAMEESGQDIFSTMFNFGDFLLMANVPNTAVNFLTNASSSIFDVISYSGIQILIFLSGIQSVPKHLYEAAKIEGATQYEIFWKITFPMVSPLMLTAGVYTVVDSFIRSDLLKIMSKYEIAGDETYTLGLGNLTSDGVYAAMSVLFFLVAVAVIAIVFLFIKPLVFYYDE